MSSSSSIVGPQWSVASASAGRSPPGSPASKHRAASPDRPRTLFEGNALQGKSTKQSPLGTPQTASPDHQKNASLEKTDA